MQIFKKEDYFHFKGPLNVGVAQSGKWQGKTCLAKPKALACYLPTQGIGSLVSQFPARDFRVQMVSSNRCWRSENLGPDVFLNERKSFLRELIISQSM